MQGKALRNAIKVGFIGRIRHLTSSIFSLGHVLAKMRTILEHEFMVVACVEQNEQRKSASWSVRSRYEMPQRLNKKPTSPA